MLVQIRKITIRVLVFIAVAMSTAFFVNKFQNGNMDRVYTEMDEPKLPIVFCNFDGEPINMMRGYTHVMNTSLMRQGIIPLNENHGVDILVYDDTN